MQYNTGSGSIRKTITLQTFRAKKCIIGLLQNILVFQTNAVLLNFL